MTDSDFMALSGRERHVLLIAMQVRNALEDFHVAYLSDPQMKELNQTIRYAINDAVVMLESVDDDPKQAWALGYLASMIPDYWEVPGRDPRPGGELTG